MSVWSNSQVAPFWQLHWRIVGSEVTAAPLTSVTVISMVKAAVLSGFNLQQFNNSNNNIDNNNNNSENFYFL